MVQLLILKGCGIVPSLTSSSNSDGDTPMYVAASGWRRPRLSVLSARSAEADTDTSYRASARKSACVLCSNTSDFSLSDVVGSSGLILALEDLFQYDTQKRQIQ
jgi:hypothetical protein